MNEYNTIMENNTSTFVEKKSKFICNIFHVDNEEDAKTQINKIRKEYYDARHTVFAYIVLDDNNKIERFSDDGEPSGTAGKPLLEILKQKNIINVLVTVTRYFGGILLGTGGLIRAYSNTALICLEQSKICNMIKSDIINFEVNYDEIDKIKYYCDKNLYKIEKIQYEQNIILDVLVNNTKTEDFIENIKKILNRNADITIKNNVFVKK